MNQFKSGCKKSKLLHAVEGHSTKSVVFDFFTSTFYLFLTFAYSYSTAIVALYLKFIH